jgi:hypothetical protein
MWNFTEVHMIARGSQSLIGQLLGIGQDKQGELYLLTKEPGLGVTGHSGLVYKIIPPGD